MLDVLRESATALPVSEVAEHVGLHPNTVRWHLDQLTESGRVKRSTEARMRAGRPRLLYSAVGAESEHATDDLSSAGSLDPSEHGDSDGYRLLADILAGYIEGHEPDPVAAATRAGRAWGGYLVDRPAPFTKLTPDQAAGRVLDLLGDLGFAPEPHTGGDITLHACPFREVARAHPDVVCSVHLGLMQGALAELGAPAEAARLKPFTTPHTCHAALSSVPAARSEPPSGEEEPSLEEEGGRVS